MKRAGLAVRVGLLRRADLHLVFILTNRVVFGPIVGNTLHVKLFGRLKN